MHTVFEIGYPAHPEVLERRRKAINQCCFFAPSIVKNEIEYMHAKIEGVSIEDEEAQMQEGQFKYEKEFTTGDLGLSLIKS